jgi:Archaeal fructose-1,6-bisphosphatase and related enzymes of inositol monophosphatase family
VKNPVHPLLAPVQALHRRIRRDVVQACEQAAVATLSGVARDEEGDTIYAIDRVAEHVLVEEIGRTMASRDAPIVLVAEGLPGGEVVVPEGADRQAARWVIIVDPIDGTRAYISGRADWTISVALVENGRPVLAALYAPVSDEMFLAVQGDGAALNGARIATSRGQALERAKFAGPKRYLDKLAGLNPSILAQPKVYSLALRLARVAHGGLDAAFASPGSHDWDLAAADLLVHEAGGVMTDFTGRPLRYNAPHIVHGALIAAGPARHGTLIDLVRDRKAEFA